MASVTVRNLSDEYMAAIAATHGFAIATRDPSAFRLRLLV